MAAASGSYPRQPADASGASLGLASPQSWPQGPAKPPQPGQGLHLWLAELKAEPLQISSAWELLTAGEITRAQAYRYERPRTRFVLARAFLRCTLAAYLGCAAGSIEFTYGTWGKPGLTLTDLDIRFSQSHSGDWTLLGVSKGHEIGVDLEKMKTDEAYLELASALFGTEELKALKAHPRQIQAMTVYRNWAMEEAWLKARGLGLSAKKELKSALGFHGPGVKEVIVSSDSAEPDWRITSLDLLPGYATAICVQSDWKPSDLSIWLGSESSKSSSG